MSEHMTNIEFEEEARKLKELVRTTIERKLGEFPLSLNLMLYDDCIFSGSGIASIYHGEEAKDYDLWCKTRILLDADKQRIIESYMNYVGEYSDKYDDGKSTTIVDGEKEKKYLITANAITFTNKVQLITITSYNSARTGFDFIHCMPYYDMQHKKLYISPNQLDAIKNRKLVINGNLRAQDWRIQKFLNRGWSF